MARLTSSFAGPYTPGVRFISLGLFAVLSLSVVIGSQGRPLRAQGVEAGAKAMAADKYDRNAQVWALQRSGFASGWQRGQEIYFMRCWMCHNDYTAIAEPTRGVSLRNLYRQAESPDDRRAVDDRIRRQVRSGSARMPAYSTSAMADNDLEDLVEYLREKCGTFTTGSGCFDEHNPPPNPNYKGN